MTRRFRVPATALFLSAIMAMAGAVPHDAMAGIAALSQSTGGPIAREEGPAKIRPGAGLALHPQQEISARYWMRGIVLLIVILLILWLIYRSYTGWKPMIS